MTSDSPIVLLEDDEEDVLFFSEALKTISTTHKLIVLGTGTEGLNFLRSSRTAPFIIFCDINMPGMSGIQLRNEIDADPVLKKKSIPFVFLSTASIKSEIERAFELTVQGYFIKPNSFRELADMMQIVLSYWTLCRHPNDSR